MVDETVDQRGNVMPLATIMDIDAAISAIRAYQMEMNDDFHNVASTQILANLQRARELKLKELSPRSRSLFKK